MGILADTLVSRGGYNRIDAENAERGPRASELTREFLGGGATPQAQAPIQPGISGGGGVNVLETAKQLLGFQQQANQPAIQSLQQQAGEVGQSFAGQRQRLESGIQPLRDRYNQILEQMKGRVSTDLSREYGRRGIPLSSGMFEQNLTERINPMTRDIGLASEEGTRGIQDLIASLTGQETESKRNITNAIAQLQAGEPSSAVTQALSMFTQQRQSEQNAAELALKQAEARKPINVSEGATLFDPTTGKPIYTAPKTYKPEENVFTPFNLQNLQNLFGGGITEPKPTRLPPSVRPESRTYGYSGLT